MTVPAPEEAYDKRDRRADRRRGRRDGKQRIPAYNDVLAMTSGDGVITTPYPQCLQSSAVSEMNQELADCLRRRKPLLETLEVLRRQHANTKYDLDRASDGITGAEAPLTEEELLPRSRAEVRPDQAVVVRSRREAARARRIAAAHGGEAALHEKLNELDSRIAETEQAVRSDFVLVQAKAKQIGARCAVRVGTYWEHLVLAHAEGTYLAPMVRYVSQVLPSWVFEPVAGEPDSLGQGDYELHYVIERVRPEARAPESGPGTEPEGKKRPA
ncbi:hypothetical protein [Amycolatopsis sp. NPDC003731]